MTETITNTHVVGSFPLDSGSAKQTERVYAGSLMAGDTVCVNVLSPEGKLNAVYYEELTDVITLEHGRHYVAQLQWEYHGKGYHQVVHYDSEVETIPVFLTE